MEKFYIFIIGICLGFFICVILTNDYHKRIAKRGFFSINDKLYEVKIKVE